MTTGEISRASAQRGSVSVEFMLLMPLFLMLIVGAIHFGSIINTRHRLTDSVNYAVRAAAVQRTPTANAVRTMIEGRMGANQSDCTTISVVSNLIPDGALTRLEIAATCNLSAPLGSSLLGAVGPDTLTVQAAMPY